MYITEIIQCNINRRQIITLNVRFIKKVQYSDYNKIYRSSSETKVVDRRMWLGMNVLSMSLQWKCSVDEFNENVSNVTSMNGGTVSGYCRLQLITICVSLETIVEMNRSLTLTSVHVYNYLCHEVALDEKRNISYFLFSPRHSKHLIYKI